MSSETDTAALNQRLAEAIGYTQRPTTDLIAAELAGDWLKPDGSFYDNEPPDFANDPAASRELVQWLAKQDIFLQVRFEEELQLRRPSMIDYLTTSPFTIALAADAALTKGTAKR